jgi:phosphoglycerol transferase
MSAATVTDGARPAGLAVSAGTRAAGVEWASAGAAGSPAWRALGRELAGYAFAVGLCLVLLTGVLRLWRSDLRAPITYAGADAMNYLTLVQTTLESGWFLHSDRLGAPFGHDFHDFPMAESLHFLCFKLLGLATWDAAVILWVYYLLGFPLVTVTSLFVLRHFRIAYAPALLASLLFAFTPYHLWRGILHLSLASYYLVPLGVMVALWLHRDGGWLVYRDPLSRKVRLRLFTPRALGAVAVCLLLSSAGVYYAFFACFLYLVAGLAASLTRRRPGPLVRAALLVGVTSLGVLANLSPTFVYRWRHGPNPEVAQRVPGESEIYGLKVVQLLLPIDHHRLAPLRELSERYYHWAVPLRNENMWSTLGTVGSGGFLILVVGVLLRQRFRNGSPTLFDALVNLNLFAVLLGTIGGFGMAFALLVSPSIRCYNRISIYIAFFSLLAVALLLDACMHRFAVTRGRRVLFWGLCGVVLLAGLYDQTTWAFVPQYALCKESNKQDAAFVGAIEAALPPRAAVFQLPYMPFPETIPPHHMIDYAPLCGYVHSRNLRWSYGAMRGREGDAWQRTVVALPPEAMLEALVLSGFDGLWIDRDGYPPGDPTEQRLAAALQVPPLLSANHRLAFYNLTAFRQRLRAGCTEEEWAERLRLAAHPVTAAWKGGFYRPDGDAPGVGRWCAAEGDLILTNPYAKRRQVRVALTCSRVSATKVRLRVAGVLSADVQIDAQGQRLDQTVLLEPGDNVVHFICDGPRVDSPQDPRVLYFHVHDFFVSP